MVKPGPWWSWDFGETSVYDIRRCIRDKLGKFPLFFRFLKRENKNLVRQRQRLRATGGIGAISRAPTNSICSFRRFIWYSGQASDLAVDVKVQSASISLPSIHQKEFSDSDNTYSWPGWFFLFYLFVGVYQWIYFERNHTHSWTGLHALAQSYLQAKISDLWLACPVIIFTFLLIQESPLHRTMHA